MEILKIPRHAKMLIRTLQIFDIGNSRFGVVPKKVLGANASDPHHPHRHHSGPSPTPFKNSKAETYKPVVRRPSLIPRHAPSTDNPPLVRRHAPAIDAAALVRRQASATSDATSLLTRGFSSSHKSTLAYSTLLLFAYSFFSTRGSARILIAGFLCLFLLQ